MSEPPLPPIPYRRHEKLVIHVPPWVKTMSSLWDTAPARDSNSSSSDNGNIVGQATRADEEVAGGRYGGGGGSPSSLGVVFFSVFGVLVALFLLYHAILRWVKP